MTTAGVILFMSHFDFRDLQKDHDPHQKEFPMSVGADDNDVFGGIYADVMSQSFAKPHSSRIRSRPAHRNR